MQLQDEVVIFIEGQRNYLDHLLGSGYFQEIGGVSEWRDIKTTVAKHFYGV
jgi:hypothetical protein